jgi:putative restriction endonuclease
MGLAQIKSRESILKAIQEFDRLGRDEFLSRYGFGKARSYFLENGGKLYDSKAIVGVAHGYEFPQLGPLKAFEFNGGDTTVKRKLEELCFTVYVKKR